MSCEYCKGGKPFGNGTYGCRIERNVLLVGKSMVEETGYPINLCPMCGDPLTEPQPLTLDELRKRDGKPVWIVVKTDGYYDYGAAQEIKLWAILRTGIVDPCATSVYGIRYSFKAYGKTWLAYDHPPKETPQDSHYPSVDGITFSE